MTASGTRNRANPPGAFEQVLVRLGERHEARARDLARLASRIVELFTAVAHVPAPGVTSVAEVTAHLPGMESSIASIAAQAHQLASRDRSAMQLIALLHQLARTLASEIAPGDAALAARLEDLAFQMTATLLEEHLRVRSAGYLQFQTQHRHYQAITNLLHRHNRDSHSLAWLSQTEVRSAYLALWEGSRDERTGAGTLNVIGTYDVHDGYRSTCERHEVTTFPPASMFELADGVPDCLVFVLPVRFDDSDWGLLALLGPLRMNESAVLEMFNHWVVLLAVAFDQEQAVRSLVDQREDLLAAYERERTLTEEIRVSEERYALAADAASDGLWDWNLVAGTTYYSARWKSLLGYAGDEVRAAPDEWLDRIHPGDRKALDRVLAQQLDGQASTMELEYRMRARDGSFRWMLTRGRSVRDEHGNVIRLVGSMTDVTDRRILEDQLRHDALYDALTGLPNRTLFLDRLNQAIEHAKRTPGYWFAVVFLDLDGFKVVNDSLGHQAGDQVLISVASRLTREMRGNDTVSRFGGDEFVVLLNDLHSLTDLSTTIDRILATLSEPLVLDGQAVGVSAAAGVATSLAGHQTADEILRDADTAMYRAKATGSGASVLFDESMHSGAMARLQLESDLRRAVADGQFELHFQPVLDISTGRLVGLEALIRWNHPTRGLVPPAEFLPVAEAAGLSQQLGRWTFTEVCRHLRRWGAATPSGAGFTVSVNLSNRQFWDVELRDYACRALADHDVPASALVFEVTEGVIMDDPQRAARLLGQLHDDGFALHVDDFGIGRSSLELLHTFPIDALKIDRSFVGRVEVDSRSAELVRVMVVMGRNLGIDVIAEGVETAEQADLLGEFGCPRAQGYLYSRPVPAPQVPQLLASAGLASAGAV